jgi:hypothetical protein
MLLQGRHDQTTDKISRIVSQVRLAFQKILNLYWYW